MTKLPRLPDVGRLVDDHRHDALDPMSVYGQSDEHGDDEGTQGETFAPSSAIHVATGRAHDRRDWLTAV